MNNKQIELIKRIEKFKEAHFDYENSINSFFNKITTLSVALIGLLVALKPSHLPDYYSKMSFLITIILIGLCILCSLIAQHYNVSYHKQQSSSYKSQLLEYSRNPDTQKELRMDSLKKSKIYKISEKMCVVFLVLYVFSLISYVYFLEFNLSDTCI